MKDKEYYKFTKKKLRELQLKNLEIYKVLVNFCKENS